MTIFVTGASGAIGSAISRLVLEQGHDVVLAYNSNPAPAKELEAQYPSRAAAIKVDVTDHQQVKDAFQFAKRQFGGVDALVNNAGVDKISCFQLVTDEELDHILAVNLKGAYYCCEEAFEQMNGKKKGTIVNISSIWGVRGASCEAAYSASKAGLIGLTQALAEELAPSGIRVNCVAPGVILSPMNDKLGEAALEELKSETPLGKLGTGEDVAQTVLFLLSDQSQYITGQTITVDGGFSK